VTNNTQVKDLAVAQIVLQAVIHAQTEILVPLALLDTTKIQITDALFASQEPIPQQEQLVVPLVVSVNGLMQAPAAVKAVELDVKFAPQRAPVQAVKLCPDLMTKIVLLVLELPGLIPIPFLAPTVWKDVKNVQMEIPAILAQLDIISILMTLAPSAQLEPTL